MLKRPKPLAPGDHVAVLAISSPSEMPRIDEAVEHMEAIGLKVTLAPNIGRVNAYLAGSDDERLQTFNQFLRSDEYDGFMFARGGYRISKPGSRTPTICARPLPPPNSTILPTMAVSPPYRRCQNS